jgi:hypothetical protein
MGSLRGYDLESAIARAFRPSSGYWRTECPKCWDEDGRKPSKQNLTINTETGKYSCWKCQSWGHLDENSREHVKKAEVTPEETIVELPESSIPVIDRHVNNKFVISDHYIAKQGYVYLTRRGVTPSTMYDANIHVVTEGKHAGYVCVPITSEDELKGFVLRSIVGKKYWSPTHRSIFNVDALFEQTDEPVAVVEGCFDALPHYPNACAMLGKPTKEIKQVLLESRRPLAIAMDADAQQLGWSLATWLQLEGKRASFVQLPPGTDPGELSREEFSSLVRVSCGLK